MLDRRDVFRAGVAGLLASPVASASERSIASINAATRLADLRAASIGSAIFYDGAIYAWTPGDFSKPPLGPVDNFRIVKQDQTPLTVGAWVRQLDAISVQMHGAVEGATANPVTNTAAFRRAIAQAVSLGRPLDLNGGLYLLDADGEASGGVNFAHDGLIVRGGGATLRFIGKGKAFVLDRAGGDGDFLEGMSVQDLVIVGGADVTDGFYSRGIVRSAFKNIQVRDVSGKAFHLRHAVSNHYENLKYSPTPTTARIASHGLYIDNNGVGFYSTDSVFVNAVMENFNGTGCFIANATGLLFAGGTFEACATGLVVSPDSHDNVFTKVWMEANRVADAIVSGSGNGFFGSRFASFSFSGPNIRITDRGRGTWFAGGGYIRYVEMAAGSIGTTFHQAGVDENRSGTIGFQGAGPFTRIGCSKIGSTGEVVGAYDDVLGVVQSIGNTGSWSPVIKAASGEIRLNRDIAQGSFHRVGKLVFAQCFLAISSVRSPIGSLSIAGLPYASAFRQPGSIYATQLRSSATPGPLQVQIEPRGTTLSISKLSAGATADVAADIAAGTTLALSIVYTAID